jgi:hypothetical protein
MPILPRLSRSRLCVAGVLLLASGLVVVVVLTAPGPLDAARAKYDRIEAGMTWEEVDAILSGWEQRYTITEGFSTSVGWCDPRSGATIAVGFQGDTFGGRRNVTGKDFLEGDQSFRAKVERLKNRLAKKMHHGPWLSINFPGTAWSDHYSVRAGGASRSLG